MRIFKTVLLVAFFGANVRCLPLTNDLTNNESKTESKPDGISSILPSTTASAVTQPLQSGIDYYDQRQNGTENYRIHVDGVVLVFAPVEALLLADAASNGSTEFNLLTNGTTPFNIGSNKPHAGTHDKIDLSSSKAVHR